MAKSEIKINSLKLFRLKRGYTQEALAAKLGVTQALVAQVESGRRRTSFGKKKLAILRSLGYKGDATKDVKLGLSNLRVKYVNAKMLGITESKRVPTALETKFNPNVFFVDSETAPIAEADKKLAKMVKERGKYQDKRKFMKDFLNTFNVDIFIGVNSFGSVAFKLYYKGKKIHSEFHQNGGAITTLS